ncbi:WD repeat-containing protein 27 isoform X3 [Oryzias melastigma]|uniref:WD repeat-containing protein 27 isoform X3 n=1 Tax=Oryzias melastigma TaxID=30732 RepID=UPI000CF8075E|nr:WD repeat-containing protein 27 isoform X3 [Oryzias melastigma]
MIREKIGLTCDRLSHQQLACCPLFFGIPHHGKDLLVYNIMDLQQKPLLLTGHHGDVSAMAFGKVMSSVLLCSASADYIIVWDIEKCQKQTQNDEVATGMVIGTLLGKMINLSFCFCDERVAACSEAVVYILSSKTQETLSVLTGHLGPLTAAEFCPWNENILISTSEDRTFKVWDLKTETVLYQSFVLSAFPLLSVLFLESERFLIVGSADGQVFCYSLCENRKFSPVTKMDLQKLEKRYKVQRNVSNQGGNARQQHKEVGESSTEDKVETSKPVLALFCPLRNKTANEEIDNSWFCIGSSDGLYVVNLATSELLTVLYFKEIPSLTIHMAGSWSISPTFENSVLVLVSSLFTPHVALLEMCLDDLKKIGSGDEGLSVFPSSPPLHESSLNAELKMKGLSNPKKKGSVLEQPLVFHPKVKSSGYTSAPRRVMFSPKTNPQKKCSPKKNKNELSLHTDYPADDAAPTIPGSDLSLLNNQILCLQYSGDGKQILCGLEDNSVLIYKSCMTGRPKIYLGHDKPVRSVSWSLGRQCWLSASEDLSLRMWTHCSSEPAIIMGDGMFSKPIKGAQFYYLDKFVLLASGPSLHLYLYNVDVTCDDIKRYQRRSVFKLASCLKTSSTEITAMSAINDFLSYIVLVCGSDRSIQVVDMNKGGVASTLTDAHSRSIHCITQNKGSRFCTQTSDSYNLFLTSAITDGLKLWDLRTMRCVRRYDSHAICCHPCFSAISPCGRFIATGSEDKCGFGTARTFQSISAEIEHFQCFLEIGRVFVAYIYDIRSSIHLHKLQRHSDTVFSVAFNPAKPQVDTH